ncbi:MAG TPA: cytochrome c peroxidase [Phycisphaerales bacterium]|nr:cytochrome c peroxidase [Phycisphaerales bacterium]
MHSENVVRVVPSKRSLWATRLVAGLAIGVPTLVASVLGAAYLNSKADASLPPVPVPPENPITEQKRVLGKILFWDEQFSSSNVVACATCHIPEKAGADPRIARNPGIDATPFTDDDILGSIGVIKSDTNNDFAPSIVFGSEAQITGRAANGVINAAYYADLFWDGRARSEFRDPLTNDVVIAEGGALESQAVGPPLSGVEMAHAGLSWNDLTTKLANVRPLDLATDIPPDVAAVLASKPSYGDLFAAAFGDPAITPVRIAKAIATYERTLISDQTPWDAFTAGDDQALTPRQQDGFAQFVASSCITCHSDPLFKENDFRNIGLRPNSEDLGLAGITGNPFDSGKFKTPTIRNSKLKATFMHNGMFTTLGDVVRFYTQAPGSPPMFQDNLDTIMQFTQVPANMITPMVDFMGNGLLDPRVLNGTFPFDKPLLFTERSEHAPVVLGGGIPGTGGVVPQIIAASPAMINIDECRVGVANARITATAALMYSRTPPVGGVITPEYYYSPKTVSALGAATEKMSITIDMFQPGETIYMQWKIEDPLAAGGFAYSSVAAFPIFCGSMGCPCDAIDFNRNGVFPEDQDVIDFFNVLAGADCPYTSVGGCDIDFNNNGVFPEDQDVIDFFTVLAGGPCN